MVCHSSVAWKHWRRTGCDSWASVASPDLQTAGSGVPATGRECDRVLTRLPFLHDYSVAKPSLPAWSRREGIELLTDHQHNQSVLGSKEEENTFKRFFLENQHIHFDSGNWIYCPILCEKKILFKKEFIWTLLGLYLHPSIIIIISTFDSNTFFNGKNVN